MTELDDLIHALRTLCNRADVYMNGTVTTHQIRSFCDLWSIRPEPMYRAFFTSPPVNSMYAQPTYQGIPYKSMSVILVNSVKLH